MIYFWQKLKGRCVCLWITTKSIVREIKKNQETLAEKIDLLATEQKENSSTLQKQIDVISSRLENLEKISLAERETISNQFEFLNKGLEVLKQLIKDAQGQISNVVVEQTQTFSGNVSAFVGKETEMLLGQIDNSTDKICGNVKNQTDKYEHTLIDAIENAKKKSDSDREQCITILVDAISERIEQLENEISEKNNDVVLETRKRSDDIVKEIESICDTVQSVSSVAASKDAVMLDNIETMNHAMQEIMQNLMSLDEGNRLIIAKLLLRDMEI